MAAAYPTATELVAFLGGLPEPVTVDATTAGRHMSRAVAELEQRTGFRPFLGATAVATYNFDPPTGPGMVMSLRGGFWSVTAVYADAYDDFAGTLLDPADYELLPRNHALDGKPVTEIKFRRYVGSESGAIRVDGKRGYAQALPDDLFEALLERAAVYALPASYGGEGPITRRKQGDREEQYGLEAGRSRTSQWVENFDATISRYTRITL